MSSPEAWVDFAAGAATATATIHILLARYSHNHPAASTPWHTYQRAAAVALGWPFFLLLEFYIAARWALLWTFRKYKK